MLNNSLFRLAQPVGLSRQWFLIKDSRYFTLAYFYIAGKRRFAVLYAAFREGHARQFGLIFPVPVAKMQILRNFAYRSAKPATSGQARR